MGRQQTIRLAFAGHNDQPYQSLGRWLIDQGEIRPGEASWPAIRDWARRNPQRVPEMLAANPRVVFFREEPLPDPNLGPRGAQGVALTPERSIAVDPKSLPYGSLVWLDTTEPLTATPLRRLVLAQDTGSAITGAVRADYFWGWGERAEQQAGRMSQAAAHVGAVAEVIRAIRVAPYAVPHAIGWRPNMAHTRAAKPPTLAAALLATERRHERPAARVDSQGSRNGHARRQVLAGPRPRLHERRAGAGAPADPAAHARRDGRA